MGKCQAKAGSRGCTLGADHKEKSHRWEGVCDHCRGAGRPVVRVVELGVEEISLWMPEVSPRPEKLTLHLCAFCPVVAGVEGLSSSTTCGMIPNGHTCACGAPATRWLEAARQFFCAQHGPDLGLRRMLAADFKALAYASGVLWEKAPGRPGLWNVYAISVESGKVKRGRLVAGPVVRGQAGLHIERIVRDGLFEHRAAGVAA